MTDRKTDARAVQSFHVISCNRFECMNKSGTGCKKSEVRMNTQGECLDFAPGKAKKD